MTPDAYVVYNVLLNDFVKGDKEATVSIVRFTRLESLDCIARVESSEQWKSAVDDLRRRNATTRTIEPKFDLPFRYELAESLEEVGGLRPPQVGYELGRSAGS